MEIAEGIIKAMVLVILVVILMFLAKKPTVENKFTMRKYIKWIFTIEIVLIIYITITRLYFEYSFLYSLFFGEKGDHYLIFGFVEIILILFPMVILSNLLAFLISNLILGNGWSIVI